MKPCSYRFLPAFLLLMVLLSGCGHPWRVQTAENLASYREQLQQRGVSLLLPMYQPYMVEEREYFDYEAFEKLQDKVPGIYKSSIRKAGFPVSVYTPADLLGSGFDLSLILELRHNILQAISNQENPFEMLRGGSYYSNTSFQRSVMLQPPRLAPRFAQLAGRLASPYVAVSQLISFHANPSKHVLFLVLVDLERGMTIYQDVHILFGKKINGQYLRHFVYESFHQLKSNLQSS